MNKDAKAKSIYKSIVCPQLEYALKVWDLVITLPK